MKLASWAITYRGRRSENQDSVLIPSSSSPEDGAVIMSEVELGDDGMLCALADGVGGRPGGAWASQRALDVLHRIGCPTNSTAALSESLRQVQDRVRAEGAVRGGPATTIAGVSCSRARAIIFNAGDSRVYRLDAGSPQLMSIDHLSRTDGRSVTRFLGGHLAQATPHIIVVEEPYTHRYLICSDGLYAFVRSTDLLLPAEIDPTTALTTLIGLAMDNGSQDNISAIFCQID